MQVGRSLGWSVRRRSAQRKKVIEVPITHRLELTRLAQLVARVSTNKLVQIEAAIWSLARHPSRLFVRSKPTVMEKLPPLIQVCKAAEVMVITATYDHDARRRSYSLLADAFGIGKQAAA